MSFSHRSRAATEVVGRALAFALMCWPIAGHAQPPELRVYKAPPEILEQLQEEQLQEEQLQEEQHRLPDPGEEDRGTLSRRPEANRSPLTGFADLHTSGWMALDEKRLYFGDPTDLELIKKRVPTLLELSQPPKTHWAERLSADKASSLELLLKSLPAETHATTVFVQDDDRASEPKRSLHLQSLNDNKDIIVVPSRYELLAEIKNNPDALVLVKQSSNPARGIMALRERVTSIEVLDALPQNNGEYFRLYNTEKPDNISLDFDEQSFKSEVVFPVTRLAVEPGANQPGGIAKVVMDRLRNRGPEELVLIMAHVDVGRARFPDGTSLPTGDILRLGGAIIGCNTVAFAPEQAFLQILTFQTLSDREARGIVKEIARAVREQRSDPTMENVLRDLQKALPRCIRGAVLNGCVQRDLGGENRHAT